METSFHPLLRPSRRSLLQSFALAGLFGEVLALCARAGMVRVGTVAWPACSALA